MTEEQKKLIYSRLDQAREILQDAKLLLDNGSLLSAVNRFYYACFYSVEALLRVRGLSSSKHTGIRSLFNQHLVKPGIVPTEYGQFYSLIFKRRHEKDIG